MNSQEVTYYLLFVIMVKSVEKTLVKLTLKVCIHSLKLKMLLLIHCSQISKTSNSITEVLELKNLVTLLKVAKEDLVVEKEEAIVVVATEEVLAAEKEKAMVVVKERVMAVAKEKATVAVILAEAEDVKVEAALAVSEISLVNHAKVEAERAKEDADLNHNPNIKLSSPIYRAVFFNSG